MQKCELYNPESCSSSTGHTGNILHYLLDAHIIEQAIKYWLALTSLWSYKLRSVKKSIYFSTN